jgi:hypothetical protein
VIHESRAATGALRIALKGATIDRCPDLGNHVYTFRVRQQDGKKDVVLQANNHKIFTGWTEAIEKAGATVADSRPFEAKLRNPQFTIVPIGGSGVGKSTFCNLISGAQWLAKNGFLQGYEDAMFETSKGVKSRTMTDDAVMLLREWCGLSRVVFAVMDTPSLWDGGGLPDSNFRSIVKKLKAQQRVNCFVLLLNAASNRFSPQEAQVMEVLDRILTSENAGSFLEHTVIILNRAGSGHFQNEQRTKEEYVRMIQARMREQHESRDEMQQLVDEITHKASVYEDESLFDGLRQRTFLFPGFNARNTYTKAKKALTEVLACVSAMETFDCAAAPSQAKTAPF